MAEVPRRSCSTPGGQRAKYWSLSLLQRTNVISSMSTRKEMELARNGCVLLLSRDCCGDALVERHASRTARARTLYSPALPSGLLTMLCTTTRGSRIKALAFQESKPIMSQSSPSQKKGSTGVIRGDPSRRTVPTNTTPGEPSSGSSDTWRLDRRRCGCGGGAVCPVRIRRPARSRDEAIQARTTRAATQRLRL